MCNRTGVARVVAYSFETFASDDVGSWVPSRGAWVMFRHIPYACSFADVNTGFPSRVFYLSEWTEEVDSVELCAALARRYAPISGNWQFRLWKVGSVGVDEPIAEVRLSLSDRMEVVDAEGFSDVGLPFVPGELLA